MLAVPEPDYGSYCNREVVERCGCMLTSNHNFRNIFESLSADTL